LKIKNCGLSCAIIGTMDRERFEELVVKAVEGLPKEFLEKLENVEILVEDMPNSMQMRRSKLGPSMLLLGLYEGIPQTGRGPTSCNLVMPDKITIFQKAVESVCTNEQQIESEVREVVKHEIAHHFGISDATLHEIEKQKNKRNKNLR
jgi:predicted Zn-dependent protease with MMP-like domain